MEHQRIQFKNDMFGKITPLEGGKFAPPTVYPKKNEHPRVLFTKKSLETVRRNLTAAENKWAYEKYISRSQTETTGILQSYDDGKTPNMSYEILAIIEAKAFRYALTHERSYAEDALYAIKNFILTLNIPEGSIPDDCRAYGYVMYIAACVYDWCYDILTDDDKFALIAGCESLLAPHFEVGMPPLRQGTIVGHGTEAQILRDWLCLAIASFDEYPDIYELVGGRLFHDFKPGSDFYLRSGSHWQGSAYGPYRLHFLLFAQHIISGMTDGECSLFCDGLHDAATTFVHYIRPDNQAIRVGDDFNERGKQYLLGTYYNDAFLAGAYYRDSILKGFAKKGLNDFTRFNIANAAVSPVMFLILNDPTLECTEVEKLSPINYNGSPLGSYIARSAWNDENAVMVYMKIGEAYSANHEHKDAGSFQIFYKDILASDSGLYDSYFTPQDITYNKQTISSNSLLVFNPNIEDNGRWLYSGGQSVEREMTREMPSLEAWLESKASRQARVIGHYAEPAEKGFKIVYLAGDITGAYDAQTVEHVSRYMLSIMTDRKKYPMVFATYDRVTAKDKDFKKTYLLHSIEEPTIDRNFAVISNSRNDRDGMLVVQSMSENVRMTAIGGEDRFNVNGVQYQLVGEYPNSIEESGWGRIEITPNIPSESDRFFMVMYVTDGESEYINAKPIENELFDGAQILGCAMLFSRGVERVKAPFEFQTHDDSETELYYTIAGMSSGEWKLTVNGKDYGEFCVTDESGILTFTAPSGKVELVPIAK